jgi:TolB protein
MTVSYKINQIPRSLRIIILLLFGGIASYGFISASAQSSIRSDGAVKLSISADGSLQNPAWSPDGNRLLLTRFVGGYNRAPADLFLFETDTGTTRLFVSGKNENINLPGSSWNGQTGKIVFSSSRGAHDEIYIIDGNGNNGDEIMLTDRESEMAFEPSLSPNGQHIVFESHPATDDETNGVITTYKVDRSGAYTMLTDPANDSRQPNWSPDGEKILYQQKNGANWNIWTMNSDGTDKKQVTFGAGSFTDASFSPDGTRIVYSGETESMTSANIFVIPAAGGEAVRITNHSGYDGAPSWSPDGLSIAFESAQETDPDNGTGTAIWLIKITVQSVA